MLEELAARQLSQEGRGELEVGALVSTPLGIEKAAELAERSRVLWLDAHRLMVGSSGYPAVVFTSAEPLDEYMREGMARRGPATGPGQVGSRGSSPHSQRCVSAFPIVRSACAWDEHSRRSFSTRTFGPGPASSSSSRRTCGSRSSNWARRRSGRRPMSRSSPVLRVAEGSRSTSMWLGNGRFAGTDHD